MYPHTTAPGAPFSLLSCTCRLRPPFLPFFWQPLCIIPRRTRKPCQMARAAFTPMYPHATAPRHCTQPTLPPSRTHILPPSPFVGTTSLPNERSLISDGTSSSYVHVPHAAAALDPFDERGNASRRRSIIARVITLPTLFCLTMPQPPARSNL